MRDRNIEEYCSCIFMYLHVFTINRLITQINYLVHIILTLACFGNFDIFETKFFSRKFSTGNVDSSIRSVQISDHQWLDQLKILTIYKIRDNCIYQSSRFPSQKFPGFKISKVSKKSLKVLERFKLWNRDTLMFLWKIIQFRNRCNKLCGLVLI